jgi:hypothetical protein
MTKSKSPVVNRGLSRCGAKRDRTQKAAVEVIRGGFLVLDIVKEEIPSLAGLAATYSSKP